MNRSPLRDLALVVVAGAATLYLLLAVWGSVHAAVRGRSDRIMAFLSPSLHRTRHGLGMLALDAVLGVAIGAILGAIIARLTRSSRLTLWLVFAAALLISALAVPGAEGIAARLGGAPADDPVRPVRRVARILAGAAWRQVPPGYRALTYADRPPRPSCPDRCEHRRKLFVLRAHARHGCGQVWPRPDGACIRYAENQSAPGGQGVRPTRAASCSRISGHLFDHHDAPGSGDGTRARARCRASSRAGRRSYTCSGAGTSTYFRDPDGNLIEVSNYVAV